MTLLALVDYVTLIINEVQIGFKLSSIHQITVLSFSFFLLGKHEDRGGILSRGVA